MEDPLDPGAACQQGDAGDAGSRKVGLVAVVAAGQPIGTLAPGHPPCAPASCLHWGARLPDGTYLDPLALLRPWAVRLWPWDG